MATSIGNMVVSFAMKGADALKLTLSKLQADFLTLKLNGVGGVTGISKVVEKLDYDFDKLEGKLKKVENSKGFQKLQAMGRTAGIAFGIATAAITKLVRSADPTGFRMFEAELEIMQMEIGRIFIPLLRDLTNMVKSVGEWFENLSDEQRESILWWTKLGLGVLAGVFALSKLISIGLMVGKVLTGMWSLLKFLGSTFMFLKGAVAMLVKGMVSGFGVALSALKSLWAVAAAHPLMALITVIAAVTAAALALSGGFSSVGQQVEDAQRKIEELEELLQKLEAGGRVTKKDIDKLSPEDQARIKAAAGDPKKMVEEFKKMKAEAEKEIAASITPEEAARQTAGVSTALKQEAHKGGLTSGYGLGRSRTQERLNAIGGALVEKGGMDVGEAKKILEAIKGQFSSELRKFDMSEEDQAKINKAIQDLVNDKRTRAEIKLAISEKGIEQGGINFGREKKGEKAGAGRFDPMVMAKAPQLMGIGEAMRRAQTAVQGDPRLKAEQKRLQMAAEALKKQGQSLDYLKDIRDNLKRIGLA